MTVNTNSKTGIRFGVIAVNNLDPDVVENLWYGYGAVDLSYQAALEELKAEIERDADNIEDEVRIGIAETDPSLVGDERWEERRIEDEYLRLGYDDREDYVENRLEAESWCIQIDEPTIEGNYQGVHYQISWLGGAPLLFVFESPFKGMFQLCSPCVPNAVSLESPSDVGAEGYDVPPDWRIGNDKA